MGRHANEGGSQECPNCGGLKKSVEHVLFECVSYDSPKQNFFEYLKRILLLDDYNAFLRSSF